MDLEFVRGHRRDGIELSDVMPDGMQDVIPLHGGLRNVLLRRAKALLHHVARDGHGVKTASGLQGDGLHTHVQMSPQDVYSMVANDFAIIGERCATVEPSFHYGSSIRRIRALLQETTNPCRRFQKLLSALVEGHESVFRLLPPPDRDRSPVAAVGQHEGHWRFRTPPPKRSTASRDGSRSVGARACPDVLPFANRRLPLSMRPCRTALSPWN